MKTSHLHAAVFITTAPVDVGADSGLSVCIAFLQVIQRPHRKEHWDT